MALVGATTGRLRASFAAYDGGQLPSLTCRAGSGSSGTGGRPAEPNSVTAKQQPSLSRCYQRWHTTIRVTNGLGTSAAKERPRQAKRAGRVASVVAFATFMSSLAAACGGHPRSPGVAGSANPPPTTSSAPSRVVPKNFMQKLLSYAECMRAHGISDFPDPTPGPGGQGGGFRIKEGPGSDLNPGNPTYKSADKACKSHLPNGGVQPRPTPEQLIALTKIASCMRAHGFPAFPDPNTQGTFILKGVDAGSQQFQSAMSTCQAKVSYSGPIGIASVGRSPGH